MLTILAGALMTAQLHGAPARPLLSDGSLPGYGYGYGGRTAARIDTATSTLHMQLDDKQYSGWTLGFPAQDLRPWKRSGALRLEVKGERGGERFHVGLLDATATGKVQSRVDGWGYGTVTKEWTSLVIPLSDFPDQGWWWDEKLKQERASTMDWSRIVEWRLSTDQDGNRSARSEERMAGISVRNLRLTPDAPEHHDAQAFWEAFRSDAPDREIGFASDAALWTLRKGQIAEISSTWLPDGGPAKGRALELSFRFQDWALAELDLASLDPAARDWSRHAAVGLDIFCPRSAASLRVSLLDSSRENWSRGASLVKGWNRLVLPLAGFVRDPYWQPENGGHDRRLDLAGMQRLTVLPQDGALPTTLRIGKIFLTNAVEKPVAAVPTLRILHDQVGHLPSAGKRFLVAQPGEIREWDLLDEKGKSAASGKLVPLGLWELSGDTLALGDFSRVSRPGTYRLSVGDSLSAPFRIAPDAYRDVLNASLRSYWFQRASTALSPELAGPWARPAGHPDKALPLVEVPGAKGTRDVQGGWYDAGDYGKYVVNGGIALGLLQDLQERWPTLIADGALRIPESGNGRGDLLDETRWELEWFLRMQDKDGGFFFKVATLKWDGMVMPHEATAPRHVIGKSTASTLNAVAVLAQASRLWKSHDPAFSRTCLAAARLGWSWAQAHPSISAPSETGGSGGYGDEGFDDERFWAATQLWRSTGEATYLAKIRELSPAVGVLSASFWRDVHNLPWFELARQERDTVLRNLARTKLQERADSIAASLEGSVGRLPSESFPWGSNDHLLQHALVLANAYETRPDARFRDAALEILDHVLGRNVQETCFVTGFGARSPRHPHHRINQGDSVEAPFPGLLVGGPNAQRQDDASKVPGGAVYASSKPARSWVDDWRSYASNETAINWNASLAWILAWADRLEAPRP